MLIISIKTESPSIQALLTNKWKISKTLAVCRERVKMQNAVQLSPHQQKEFCSYLIESNWQQVLPVVSKKSTLSFCRCDFEEDVKDLGKDFYPRYIPERKCVSKECCDRGICRDVVYTMKVLKLRNINDQEDDFVPSSLRDCFNFSTVNVTVACQCS